MCLTDRRFVRALLTGVTSFCPTLLLVFFVDFATLVRYFAALFIGFVLLGLFDRCFSEFLCFIVFVLFFLFAFCGKNVCSERSGVNKPMSVTNVSASV